MQSLSDLKLVSNTFFNLLSVNPDWSKGLTAGDSEAKCHKIYCTQDRTCGFVEILQKIYMYTLFLLLNRNKIAVMLICLCIVCSNYDLGCHIHI